jgi:Spy/CpxP family protein refolding chaperone
VSSPATPSEPVSGGRKPLKGAEAFDLQTLLSITRKDLSEAQRSRSELLEQLKKTTEELEKLKKKSALDSRKIADLAVERTQLQLKLRDRDEELRGKAKLLEVSVATPLLCVSFA